MTEKVQILDPVDFHGQALTVVNKDDQPYVAMKPVVEGMGLAWAPQHRKLTDEEGRWGVTMMVMQLPGDSQAREITTIPLRKLTGWLMTLQPSRMDAEVAAKVLVYQNECDDALWAYWSKGTAINPRAIAKTPAEMLLDSVQMLVDQEKKQREQETRITRLEKLEEARLHETVRMMDEFPVPAEEVEKVSDRAMVNRVVRNAVYRSTGLRHSDAFARLYREFRDRTGIDLSARARNRKLKSALDAAEADGLMSRLYAVAYEIFEVLPIPTDWSEEN